MQKKVIFTYLIHAAEMARNTAVCTTGLVVPSNAEVQFFFNDNSLLFLREKYSMSVGDRHKLAVHMSEKMKTQTYETVHFRHTQ